MVQYIGSFETKNGIPMGGTITIVERKEGRVKIAEAHTSVLFDLQDYTYLEGQASPSNQLANLFNSLDGSNDALPVLNNYGLLVIDFDEHKLLNFQGGTTLEMFYDISLRLAVRPFSPGPIKDYFEYALQKGAVPSLFMYVLNGGGDARIPVPTSLQHEPASTLVAWQDQQVKAWIKQNRHPARMVSSYFEFVPPTWSHTILGHHSALKNEFVCAAKTLVDLGLDLTPCLPEWTNKMKKLSPQDITDFSEDIILYTRQKFNENMPLASQNSTKKVKVL